MRKDNLRAVGLVMAGVCAGITFVLCCDGGPGDTGADDGGMGDGGGMGGGPGSPAKVIVASEDANQIETGMISLFSLSCQLRLGPGAGNVLHFCAFALRGPFVLTDLAVQFYGYQGGAVAFVAASDDEIKLAAFKPRWQIGPLGGGPGPVDPFRGMRLSVKANERLYIANTLGSPPLPVVWSGYRPY